jgi:DNA-directed RNA polymerase specialized sigma24 family protein
LSPPSGRCSTVTAELSGAYAVAVLRDPDAADEVFQEFALKFVRGDFGQATPDRGRFRSFLKTTLYHLIVDYQRRRQKLARQAPLATDQPSPHVSTKRRQRMRPSWPVGGMSS